MTGSAGKVESFTLVICVFMPVYSSVWLVATTEKLYMSPGYKLVQVTCLVSLKEKHFDLVFPKDSCLKSESCKLS